jgi:AraC family transcriptional regulator
MEPQIVKKPAMTLVGLQLHGKMAGMDIQALWTGFGLRMAELKIVANVDICYGAMNHYDEATGEFDYLAACEVRDAGAAPGDMVRWNVPAQTYAVFSCTLPQIGAAWTTAYRQWLPTSGYQRATGPEFELYDEKFNPQDPTATLYLYVPIVSAN